MLARRMLLGFAVTLGALWVPLWLGAGFSAVAALGLAAGVIVAARVLLVLSGFALALGYGGERPAEARLGVVSAGRMVAREIASTMRTFFLLHPFEPWLRDSRGHGRDGVPVVLVHGFFSNAGYWHVLKRFLAERGVANLHTLNLEPPFGDLTEYTASLRARIEALHAESGPVVLVGHSMGGLVCRAATCATRVQRVITLGAPYRGTLGAWLMTGRNVRQMRPGSAWLQELERAPAVVPTVSIYGYYDNVVVPYSSAVLGGADNIPLPDVGHLDMGFSPQVLECVYRHIIAVHPNVK